MKEIPFSAQPHVAAGGRRGAGLNDSGRYEPQRRVVVDDGWESWCDGDLPPLRTTVAADSSRTVIARNDSPDVHFDRSINPYRGCEHGCIYCYARPSHNWLGLSSGLDFETKLFAKFDAPHLLEEELRSTRYRRRPIRPLAIGGNTDPYQPVERTLRITRGILEVLCAFNHPFTLATKSAMVVRDLDLLVPMAAKGLCAVALSLSTLDRDLAHTLEPRASPPVARLKAMEALAKGGVPVTLLAAPIIPGLNDHELEAVLEAAKKVGAVTAETILLRLPYDVQDLFTDWLRRCYPLRAERVLSLIRQTRDGALDEARFGLRMRGRGMIAEVLQTRYRLACRRLGLSGWKGGLRTDLFSPPPRSGDQLSLFPAHNT